MMIFITTEVHIEKARKFFGGGSQVKGSVMQLEKLSYLGSLYAEQAINLTQRRKDANVTWLNTEKGIKVT